MARLTPRARGVCQFFELSNSPNVVWIDLDQLNVNPGAPVLTLDPDDMELSGNITTKFQPVAKALF